MEVVEPAEPEVGDVGVGLIDVVRGEGQDDAEQPDDDYDGPTREQEEGMGFERALWLKSGPNPRRR